MIGKWRTVAVCVLGALSSSGAGAGLLSPTLEVVTSARAGGALDFRNERWALPGASGSQAGLHQSFESFDSSGTRFIEFGRLTLTMFSYDLDPWTDFTITVENFSDDSMLVSSGLVLGPLNPKQHDTVFNSAISVTSVDGTSQTAGDGVSSVGSAGNGPLAFTRLGGLDSTGFGDGNEALGASVGSVASLLGTGESLSSGMFTRDVGVAPTNASDPDAYWGVFLWGVQLTVSPHDTAVINGRIQLIPGAGTGVLIALGGLAGTVRRRH